MLIRRYRRKVASNLAKEQPKEVAPDYDAMKVPELKEAAKKKGIEGYSEMKKDELLKALRGDSDE